MITYANELQQRTPEWYKARLGNITGSKCGDLMVKGRAKDEIFGATAKSYLYQLFGERTMNPAVLDDPDMFEEYLQQTDVTSKQMRFGNDHEDNARQLFETIYDVKTAEVSSCKHDTLEHFAASPDGVVVDEEGKPVACLEIKCPQQTNFVKYSVEVKDAESLKKANSTYYWQIQAEMMCTGTTTTYFCVYNPFQANPIHVVEIPLNPDDSAALADRVRAANEYIDAMANDE